MWEVDKTCNVLYAYLQLLSVKVGKLSIRTLLNTPVGNSIRGISDALDELHIQNEVYQLPADYLGKLDTPFIAVLNSGKSPFCVVEKVDVEQVSIIDSSLVHVHIQKTDFLQKWTGAVLIGDITEQTISERYYTLHNGLDWINRTKSILAVFLLFLCTLVVVGIGQASYSLYLHIILLWLGVTVSVGIIYKEFYDKNFLQRFCMIGQVVDCNKVLHSTGGTFFGIVKLGELSLLFFATLLLYGVSNQESYYLITAIGMAVALLFTIYSIIYQALIIRKWCMLCMCVNLLLWCDGILLYLAKENVALQFSWWNAICFCMIGLFLLIVWIKTKQLLGVKKEKIELQNKLTHLFNPITFHALLSAEEEVQPINVITLHNEKGHETKNQILVITNPNCTNCAKIHQQLYQLAEVMPVSLVLITFPNDTLGALVAQKVISCYLSDGWDKAVSLLGNWFMEKNKSLFDKYVITQQGKELFERQREYCGSINLTHTPAVIVNAHYLPKVYELSDLKYLL